VEKQRDRDPLAMVKKMQDSATLAPGFCGLTYSRLYQLKREIVEFVKASGMIDFEEIVKKFQKDTTAQLCGVCNTLEVEGKLFIRESRWVSLPD